MLGVYMDHLHALDSGLRYGKFLQLYVDTKPYLITGRTERVHREMLKEVLSDAHIPFKTEKLFIGEGPSPRGDRYQLTGAGLMYIDDDTLLLSGQSDSYELKPDRYHVQDIKNLLSYLLKIQV